MTVVDTVNEELGFYPAQGISTLAGHYCHSCDTLLR